MLHSAVSILVVAQSSSEIPEGLMNNPVYNKTIVHEIFSPSNQMHCEFGRAKDLSALRVGKQSFTVGT